MTAPANSRRTRSVSLPSVNSLVGGLIRSPLNYIGGKFKILSQILPYFPKYINNFVDLFAGGCNVGINVNANTVHVNDNLTYLIEMYRVFQSNDIETTLQHIEGRIEQFSLSSKNENGYKKIRELYNEQKDPLDLFVLIAYTFNHQIRFNKNHKFNNPFGRERSSFNDTMKKNLQNFIARLKQAKIELSKSCFDNFDFSFLNRDDLVYCDPPYLITTGTYNDGKRGFTGWTEREEKKLLQILDELNDRNIKFALSNVLEHKGKSNDMLKHWAKRTRNYKIHFIDSSYANSNYQTLVRDKNASIEVLITNYIS